MGINMKIRFNPGDWRVGPYIGRIVDSSRVEAALKGKKIPKKAKVVGWWFGIQIPMISLDHNFWLKKK
jgi:hypothetical protein